MLPLLMCKMKMYLHILKNTINSQLRQPIFAPEEIPSTNGPAIGFEKNVCNKKPDRDNAPPSNAAIRIRGRRIFHMILYSTASPSCKNNILKIFGTEICTFPVLIFSTVMTKNCCDHTYKYKCISGSFSEIFQYET